MEVQISLIFVVGALVAIYIITTAVVKVERDRDAMNVKLHEIMYKDSGRALQAEARYEGVIEALRAIPRTYGGS